MADIDRRNARQRYYDAIVAAYIHDRAEQYVPSSGIYDAILQIAGQVERGEHRDAYAHGELDDLLKARAKRGKLQIWTDGYDSVIAESAEQAVELLCQSTGESVDQYMRDTDDDLGDWHPWPADKPYTLRDDNIGQSPVTMLPAEWCAQEGPGFLGSTEY